jgi:hypothetical protein
MQTKETMAKIIMENINSNYEVKKARNYLFFFKSIVFLTPKKIRILQKKYLITIFDFFQIKL